MPYNDDNDGLRKNSLYCKGTFYCNVAKKTVWRLKILMKAQAPYLIFSECILSYESIGSPESSSFFMFGIRCTFTTSPCTLTLVHMWKKRLNFNSREEKHKTVLPLYASNFWLNTYYAVGCSKSVAPEKGTMLLLRSTCGFNQTIFKKCIQYKLLKYICNHLKSLNQISDKTILIWIINLRQDRIKVTIYSQCNTQRYHFQQRTRKKTKQCYTLSVLKSKMSIFTFFKTKLHWNASVFIFFYLKMCMDLKDW